MASSKESAPLHEDIGMESRSSSDWELLSMSQIDGSGGNHNSGSSTPATPEEPNIEETPSVQGVGQSRTQLEDSFFSSLGLEGFHRAERGPAAQPESTPPQDLLQSRGQLQTDWGSLSHLGDSGVLVPPPKEQAQQGLGVILSQGEEKASGVEEKIGDSEGESPELGLDNSQGPQNDEGLLKKENEHYADSPVSPLAGPSSFGAGTPYASTHRTTAPLLQAEDSAQLKSWVGVQDAEDALDNGTESESESDLGYEHEQEEKEEEVEDEAPLVGGVDVASQTASSEGGIEGPEKGGGEKEPASALQKWFPYEAWWQKQETLRRWVRKVLSQPLTMWSLGLTTAILGALLLHQLWRNRDLQAQLKAGNKKFAEQEENLKRLKEMLNSPRRRVPIFRLRS